MRKRGGRVNNMRLRLRDRRQNEDMPRIPIKDGNGVTVNECRRKIPDRRIGDIKVEWIDDVVIS
jgi:hypothetical protein